MSRRSLVPAVVAALVLAACSRAPKTGDPGAVDGATADADELEAAVASYDVAVGPPSRFIVGLFDAEKGNVGYGRVRLRFSFLGTKEAPRQGEKGPRATAAFLPLPGSEPPRPPEGPALLRPSEGRGVYAAQVALDRPGFWEVRVTAALRGVGTRSATAAFSVLPRHAVPAPGDAAPTSENLTVSSLSAPLGAVDSRAGPDQPVPDPDLHQTTIAQAVRDGVPALVVFSTPTFCTSRFCGPVTDMVAQLARDHPGRARYIHVEIWKDFEKKQLNEAAAEWLTRNGGEGNEPWVFLIGADGKVAARWDNVATPGEIEPLLRQLPPIGKAG